MRITTFLAPVLGIFLALVASPAFADQAPATITVVGHSSVSRPPDVAVITAEIVTSAASVSSASAANDQIQDRVANALAQIRLPNDAAHTISYRSQYIAPSRPVEPHEHSGYVVTRTIEVVVAPHQIDETTRALNDAGIEAIDDVRSDLRDRDGVYHTLYIQALNDAEQQAHIIATSARVKIVRLRSVDASTLMPFVPGMAYSQARLASIPMHATKINAGITAVYEVQPFPMPGYMRRMPNPIRPTGAY